MEVTCSRCHQTVQPEDCFCPYCGLPQLVYTADGSAVPGQPERAGEPVRDAATVDWKLALRLALMLAVPAGAICSMYSPAGILGLPLMAAAGAWAVALYMRGRRPAWITIGAGARIGLVTGILGCWTAAFTTAISLYAMRFWLHQGPAIDDAWASQINLSTQLLASWGVDAQQIAMNRAIMVSPEGHAGAMLLDTAVLAVIVLGFSVAGGALGARFLGRPRRIEP
jgi:RNA polymerase subunit RPABC4/transcription elongation factor Spt4